MSLICNRDFSWSSRHFIDGMCRVAPTLATITMSGVTLHMFVMRLLMSGSYVVVFLVIDFFLENMLLQYVNFINCMLLGVVIKCLPITCIYVRRDVGFGWYLFCMLCCFPKLQSLVWMWHRGLI
jgi:hypothetical protein